LDQESTPLTAATTNRTAAPESQIFLQLSGTLSLTSTERNKKRHNAKREDNPTANFAFASSGGATPARNPPKAPRKKVTVSMPLATHSFVVMRMILCFSLVDRQVNVLVFGR